MSKKIATREAYGKALAELAKENVLKQLTLKQFHQKDSLTWELLKEI